MTDHPARQALADVASSIDQGLSNFVLRGPSLSSAAVSRFDLVEEVATTVFADVLSTVKNLLGKQFVAYDPSYMTNSSQVLVEKLNDVPELAEIDELILRGDVADDEGGETPIAMAHAVGLGKHQIVAYRMKGQGITTRRSTGFTLFPRDGVYRPVEGEVLYYEPRFDAFTFGGYVYFTSAALIQAKFHAVGKARQLAKDALEEATVGVTIEGFADLERAVMDDSNLRAKMAQIARTLQAEPEYAQNLTTKKLVTFIEAYPDYDIPLKTINGEKVLVFDSSPQHRHQIPRLLADDYLHSYLTDRKYEAGSKSRTGAKDG